MEPINIYSHLFPQAMAVLAFLAALVPVTILVIADNVASARQLATAMATVDADGLALRVERATALPLTVVKVPGVLVAAPTRLAAWRPQPRERVTA